MSDRTLLTIPRSALVVGDKCFSISASRQWNGFHWLPLQKRISYKLCLYVYKILQHSAPTYLEDMISVYTPTRTLRSMSDRTLLTIPRSALVVGDKCFSISASRQWNGLPLSLRECHSLDTFKKHLKTYLFSL